jgi:hypothetical protein
MAERWQDTKKQKALMDKMSQDILKKFGFNAPKVVVAPTKYTPAELKQIAAQKKKEAEARKTGTWKSGYTN